MCIILTCEAGIRPNDELIETCFNANPDGAGIMWVSNGRVQVSKGYTTPQNLINAIDMFVPDESQLVVHMRIATSGGIGVKTCHPFPITNSLRLLHQGDSECDAAIAHNGIIRGVRTNEETGVSDTVAFVQDYLSRIYKGSMTQGVEDFIRTAAPGNKFAIMTDDNEVYRIGVGWEVVTDGIEASNGTWRKSKLWDSYWKSSRWCGTSGLDVSLWDVEKDMELARRDAIDKSMEDFCSYGCRCWGSCREYGPMCPDQQQEYDDLMAMAGYTGYL